MLIWDDTRERAEAAQGPSPLGLEMLRAARALHRAEAARHKAQGTPAAAALDQAAEAAQASLEAAVEQFCKTHT